ncbi:tyrosine-protein phosphatase [Paenibacillus hodogayensis]|uniref:Tyrosine-protein phosphatase n=1 Tax=Paenibacillus hodogayensis TaxID=279208 RepID=A0ABV5VXP7_9BACL
MTKQTIPQPDCLLSLEGAMNFRDMGGYRTDDGRTVRHGLLYRAAELTGLTPGDHQVLEGLGIRHVLDYRNRAEAELKPDPAIGQAVLSRIPANLKAESSPHVTMEQMFKAGIHKAFTADMLMKTYAELPVGNEAYKLLMKLLAEPELNLPLVHHCAGGRDRTGVGSLLILLTLGVPYETAVEDFLLSNVTLTSYHESLFEMAIQYVSKEEIESFKDAMLLKQALLDTAMTSILEKYGSFERYLEAEFGIDAAARERIQAYCLR